MSPSNPVPEQSQVKVPGVLEHDPVLHGVPVAHSFISEMDLLGNHDYLHICNEPLNEPLHEKPALWVPTRPDTNRAVQSQKMVRGWKFCM